jgi:hypothetical protein
MSIYGKPWWPNHRWESKFLAGLEMAAGRHALYATCNPVLEAVTRSDRTGRDGQMASWLLVGGVQNYRCSAALQRLGQSCGLWAQEEILRATFQFQAWVIGLVVPFLDAWMWLVIALITAKRTNLLLFLFICFNLFEFSFNLFLLVCPQYSMNSIWCCSFAWLWPGAVGNESLVLREKCKYVFAQLKL